MRRPRASTTPFSAPSASRRARPTLKGRVWYRTKTGAFGITKPIDGAEACHANGGTIGFPCTSEEQVNAFHAAGVAHGGKSIEDPPGWRQGAAGKIYLAYLRDPYGNKICASYRGA